MAEDAGAKRLAARAILIVVTSLSGCAAIQERLPSRKKDELPVVSKGTLESSLSLARLSERHGQIDNARQVYEMVLRNDPANGFAHHRMGIIAARQERYAEADEHFQKAIAAGPASSELLADVGYLYYRQDRLPEAEEKLRQAIQLTPSNGAAHTNLGLVMGEQGRWDECFAEFSAAGGEASAHANLAYVFALHGEVDKAEAEYRRALSLDPKLGPAADALAQLGARRRATRPFTSPGRHPAPEQDAFLMTVGESPAPRLNWSAVEAARPTPVPQAPLAPAVPAVGAIQQASLEQPAAPGATAPAVQQASFSGAMQPSASFIPTAVPAWSQPTWTPPIVTPAAPNSQAAQGN